jgi:hypothetical protein
MAQEALWAVEADASLPAGWPSKGAIEIREATMSYRAELEPAMHVPANRINTPLLIANSYCGFYY